MAVFGTDRPDPALVVPIPYKPWSVGEIVLVLLTGLVIVPVPVLAILGLFDVIQPITALLWAILLLGIEVWCMLVTLVLILYRLMSAVMVLRGPIEFTLAVIKQLATAFGTNFADMIASQKV